MLRILSEVLNTLQSAVLQTYICKVSYSEQSEFYNGVPVSKTQHDSALCLVNSYAASSSKGSWG